MELPRTASNLLFIQFDPHQKKLTLYLKMLTHTKKYLTHTKKLWCTPMKVWSILKRIDTCNHEGIQSTLAHHQNFLADSQFSLFIYLFIYLFTYLFIYFAGLSFYIEKLFYYSLQHSVMHLTKKNFCHHNFMKKSHSKLSNEPVNIT